MRSEAFLVSDPICHTAPRCILTGMTTSPALRTLRAEIDIAAAPDEVWATLTNLARMPDWSPELLRMVPLKPGGLRVGQWYLGVNKRGPVVWPTRNVVTDLRPKSLLAWNTPTSGARWIWSLEPMTPSADPAAGMTRVTVERPMHSIPPLARLTTKTLLGGVEGHADELDDGIRITLRRFKAAVEQSS